MLSFLDTQDFFLYLTCQKATSYYLEMNRQKGGYNEQSKIVVLFYYSCLFFYS